MLSMTPITRRLIHKVSASATNSLKVTNAARARQFVYTLSRQSAPLVGVSSDPMTVIIQSVRDRLDHQQQYQHRHNQWTWSIATGIAAAAALLWQQQQETTTDCCGIAGVVGTPNHDARYVRAGVGGIGTRWILPKYEIHPFVSSTVC